MRFRVDIQALRGIAVILVLLDHTQIGIFRGGYLGVDIFFVVSGFLITRMVKEGLEAGTFSFFHFYFRRAKRLLPAAYVTFLVTALLAPFFLSAVEQRDFFYQLIGSLTFTSNIVLWQQAGYFGGAAALKPLLHVWSLSLEEQYYMILPAAMALIPRRYWRSSALVILATSLVSCLILVQIKPVATFYLLPTRAWELAIGSVAALWTFGGSLRRVIVLFFWPALLALVLVPMFPSRWAHPGPDAVLVCVATLIVILRQHERLTTNPLSRALASVGDASYSLYLAHWPVFAFLNNAYVGEPSSLANILALGLAVVLGYLLYRFVEFPIRRMEVAPSWRLVSATVMSSFVVVFASVTVAAVRPDTQDFTEIRQANFGFAKECEFTERFAPRKACTNSESPKILVWGDSYAMQLVPGIVAATKAGVIQATQSACGPFTDLAPTSSGRYPRLWAEQCLAFNESVMSYVASQPGLDLVILSSRFAQYLDPSVDGTSWRVLRSVDGKLLESDPSVPVALAAMQGTIDRLRTLGKRVVVFAPPPSSGFDIGLCLDRQANRKLILGASSNCQVPLADFQRYQSRELDFIDGLTREGVNVVRFDTTLCSQQTCTTQLDGTFLYRDTGHLSYDGSRLLAMKMNWGEIFGL